MKNQNTLIITALLVIFGMLLSACGGAPGAQPATVRVGSKEFTEQFILGNMYAMLLEDAGFTAQYAPAGGTSELHQSLLADEIDVYPEYTGTALLVTLEQEYDPSMSSEDVYNTVKEQYKERWNLEVLEPTQFNNTYCLTMPEERAQEMGIDTVSELSAEAGDLVFGTTQEFTEREDGLPGLRQVYGGFNFQEVVALDPGLLYSGLDEGEIDVTTCFGTDGQISALNLRVLEDDQNFWPPYPAAPIVRGEILEQNPGIADALNPLAAVLDGDTMSSLNWEVAGNAREADEVAREFLQEQGLIE